MLIKILNELKTEESDNMTMVKNIKKAIKSRNLSHLEAGCTYCVFQNSGEKIFQIDTYKIEDINIEEQSTQKIQFDKEFAIKLIDILKKEFNL